VRLGDADLARTAGLPPGTTHASFQDLMGNPDLMRLIHEARQETPGAPGRPDRSRMAALALEERLSRLNEVLTLAAFTAVPAADDPKGTWTRPARLASTADLIAMCNRPPAGAAYQTSQAIDRELAYHRLRPTRVAWLVMALASVLAVMAMLRPRTWLDFAALIGLAAGWGAMNWELAMRWLIAGRIPAANMYESLLVLGWGIGGVALLAWPFLRNRLVVLNAAVMSALTIALTDLLPIDRFIHPVQPVLANTPWLAIHVPIIITGYAVLALGVLTAHLQIGCEFASSHGRDLARRLNDLLHWYIRVGSLLLIAGIITGSMWGASSWGRYWGWDPKEVWSLVAFLAYLAIQHAHHAALLGPFGVAAWSIAAFETILMTYLGVNFVLSSGLHSYGFGASSITTALAAAAAFELAFVTLGYWAQRRRARLESERSPAP
jgi:ABC-type transport system involved in cytochrome c biogenesis permease subunit